MAGTIHWSDLSVSLSGRQLLHAHNGVARAGRLLGVLGPSGSGKTTLLGALAGALPARARVCGRVSLECRGADVSVSVAQGNVALLEQDDAFFSELSVHETLCFAAELEGRPPHEAVVCADRLLQKTGLAHLGERRVGNRADSADRHGITKGERRRLAVACAIVGEGVEWCDGADGVARPKAAHPRALLVDEPTTGLDAFQAARVVSLLHELAIARHCAAIATLHQPRASIWAMLDDVMLVAPGGYSVYCGPREDVLSHFASLQHACPREGVNPAEFLIDTISVDAEDLEGASQALARIATLAASFASSSLARSLGTRHVPLGATVEGTTACRPARIGHCYAFRLLLRRSLLQMLRDRLSTLIRFLVVGGLASVFSLYFGKLDGGGPPSARSVATRICLVTFGIISVAMLALARALDRFAKERTVVARERAARCYSGGSYLAAKACCELPTDAAFSALFAWLVHQQCGLQADLVPVAGTFALVAVACASLGLAIGAASARAETAIALGGPVMAVHMLTGIIDPAGQAGPPPGPAILLLRSLSPIRHGIEALCVAELKGLQLARSAADAPRMGGLALVRTGDEVLRHLSVSSDLPLCVTWLCVLAGLHLLAAMVALVATRPHQSRRAGAEAGMGGGCVTKSCKVVALAA